MKEQEFKLLVLLEEFETSVHKYIGEKHIGLHPEMVFEDDPQIDLQTFIKWLRWKNNNHNS